MRNFMLDFESLSLRKNAVLLSCALVEFNASKTGHAHVFNIDAQEQIDRGRHVSFEVIRWWMQVDPSARLPAFRDGLPVATVLARLSSVIGAGGYCVWTKGPTDAAWLESLSEDYRKPCPVHYRAWRDVRTAIAGKDITVPFIGTPHDPVADCVHQIRLLQAARRAQGGEI